MPDTTGLWRVDADLAVDLGYLAGYVDEDRTRAAVESLDSDLKDWLGRAHYGGGMIALTMHVVAISEFEAHRIAVELVDRYLDEYGLTWPGRQWRRVLPAFVTHDVDSSREPRPPIS